MIRQATKEGNYSPEVFQGFPDQVELTNRSKRKYFLCLSKFHLPSTKRKLRFSSSLLSKKSSEIRFPSHNSTPSTSYHQSSIISMSPLPMSMVPFVTGQIELPPKFQHADTPARITIEMQDTAAIPSIEISKLTMDVPYLGYTTIPFALSYPPTALDADTNDWYTLRIIIESKRDGSLLCFNHRVTRAIDDLGLPRKNIKVPMTAAGPTGTANNNKNNKSGYSVVVATRVISRQRKDNDGTESNCVKGDATTNTMLSEESQLASSSQLLWV